jgi:hypothetical protein
MQLMSAGHFRWLKLTRQPRQGTSDSVLEFSLRGTIDPDEIEGEHPA